MPISKQNATGTDQPENSFKFEVPGHPSVDADKVPFIVLPGGGFAEDLGVQQGDIAAVVFNGKAVFALVADSGPKCKIGEGSIQLHEEFRASGLSCPKHQTRVYQIAECWYRERGFVLCVPTIED